jgi:hypothetical protein
MADCLWELQKVVFTALSGDGALSALVTGVYSHVPQDTAFPYIKFSDMGGQDWSTKTSSGIKSQLVLDVFSRGRGSKESLAILKEVKRILNDATLTMSGCTMVSMKFNGSNAKQLIDGLTWQGSIGFNVLVAES